MNHMISVIESAWKTPAKMDTGQLEKTLTHFLDGLNNGTIRAAAQSPSGWQVNGWVKKGILLLFRLGKRGDFSINEQFQFFDKMNLPLKSFSAESNIRIVPGGSGVRSGSFLGENVIMMPPSYVNIGAFVDDNALIDSHVLVGSCAQIGKGVHLSAGVQIGGVLEPIGSLPVIVEDHVIVGGNSGVFEGTIISQHAVIGTGVNLTRSTPVYDCVNETILRASENAPLIIPPRAVVVPGTRPVNNQFGRENHLSIQTPVIIKYRDEKTDAATAMEEALR